MRMLERIAIRNFKSIREQALELGRLSVFIGANGAGKSNLIQAFRFLREIARQNLARFSLERGAASLLYCGRKHSPFMEFQVEFGEEGVGNAYRIRLIPTDEGSLVVGEEEAYFHGRRQNPQPFGEMLGGSAKEAALGSSNNRIVAHVRGDLDSYRLYHFHDTSDTAPVKGMGAVDDNRFLRPDAGNLAAFLYLLQQQWPDYFRNIEDAVRQIAPFFDGFVLAPSRLNPEVIRLEWRERGTDAYFNALSLSDGSVRFMCLATLLLQPELPCLVLLDEPELGLHPAAIVLLADLLSSAASRTQLVVATQSVTLVNQFEPENIWTVDRQDGQSVFRHLGKGDLSTWLETYEGTEGYGLGDLWEKNVLGARP